MTSSFKFGLGTPLDAAKVGGRSSIIQLLACHMPGYEHKTPESTVFAMLRIVTKQTKKLMELVRNKMRVIMRVLVVAMIARSDPLWATCIPGGR